MNTLAQLGIIGSISVFAAGACWFFQEPQEEIIMVCEESLLAQDEICLADVPENVLWIDARSRGEWEKASPAGSILWNMDPAEDSMAMEAEAAMAIMNTGFVVIYCKSEACGTSREIAERARALQLGVEIYVLFGGWESLKDSNRAK